VSSKPDASPEQERDLTPSLVRLQLERIVHSAVLAKSTRLTAFLRYVVEQTLAGQGGNLKEQVLALELYGRTSDFDSGLDSIVRVDARRLRDRLREYYAESTGDPVIISLPKGTYVPVFERGNTLSAVVNFPAASPPEADKTPAGGRWRRPVVYAGTGAVVAAVLLGYYLRPASTRAPEVRPLASLIGEKGPPTLSPDGNFAAFFWSGPPEKPEPGIYIKSVDGVALRRLAFGSGPDVAWTPNAKTLLVRDRESPSEPWARLDSGWPRDIPGLGDIYMLPMSSGAADASTVIFYPQIWKMTSSGEQPVQITRNGGFEAFFLWAWRGEA
jgi:hypothetical protein